MRFISVVSGTKATMSSNSHIGVVPATAAKSGVVQVRSWWDALQRSHYAGQNVEFRDGEIRDQALLPRELFESAADNLIQNAINKRKLQGNFAVSVSFSCGDSGDRVRL